MSVDPTPLYLDHAATCGWRPPEVIEAVMRSLEAASMDPGQSAHPRSLAAARVIEGTRESLGELLGARDTAQIAFTKNATEALNVAFSGVLEPGDRVLVSAFEHNSVMRPLRAMERQRGVTIEEIPAAVPEIVDLDALGKRLLRLPEVAAVVVTAASNVTGRLAPLEAIGELCALHDVLFIVDAAQAVGAVPFDVQQQKIDALAVTGHKSLYAPPGIGALYLRDPGRVRPLIHGATGSRSDEEIQPLFMPDRFEAGMANICGIAGLGAALGPLLTDGVERQGAQVAALYERLRQGLATMDLVRVHGAAGPDAQLATISFTVDGWTTSALARELGRAGIVCRPGLHCAPRAHRTLETAGEGGTVRFSLGPHDTLDRVDEAVARLHAIVSS
ncbi:MAG: aminotransferase class V-fold PLP-dependent enzyme [Deltaproteobacteria bacterium]|nr:aminotransferase class V-fold PLP-dependent enzyme [Deltaproteobacteria bacterium]